jgi:hypothetical protein
MLLVIENGPDEKRHDIARKWKRFCLRFCDECRSVVAGTLLRVQEIPGWSFTLEPVFPTGFSDFARCLQIHFWILTLVIPYW